MAKTRLFKARDLSGRYQVIEGIQAGDQIAVANILKLHDDVAMLLKAHPLATQTHVLLSSLLERRFDVKSDRAPD